MGIPGTKRVRQWCSRAEEPLRGLLGFGGEQGVGFEEMEARSAFKFELAYLVVLLACALVYGGFGVTFSEGYRVEQREKDVIFVPSLVGILVRCVALSLRGRLSRCWISPHLLATFCFCVDVGFLTWFDQSGGRNFLEKTDSGPGPIDSSSSALNISGLDVTTGDIGGLVSSLQSQCVARIQADYQRSSAQEFATRRQDYDQAMVLYSLHVLFWYMTGFVLLFRHALVALPLSVAIYYSGACVAGREDRCVEKDELEVCFVVFSTTVLIFSKAYFENLQRNMFTLLQSTTKEVIKEKVSRFQAEFELEFSSSKCPWDPYEEMDFERCSFVSASVCEALNGCRPYTKSLHSAPAALVSDKLGGCAIKKTGECLPPGAVVWVEGKNVPQVVDKVAVGQRVLCHDHIARAPKYVDVVEVESLGGKTSWVDVNLTDGTVLTVTAHHPFFPIDKYAQVPDAKGPVVAAKLVPGQSLMTFKMVPVDIAKVCPLDISSQAHRGVGDRRIALSVTQPKRYEIFVTTENHGGAGVVGVGSAMLRTDMISESSFYTINKTFIDTQRREKPIRRAFSEPCCFRYSGKEKVLSAKRSRALSSKMSAWSDSEITENSSSMHGSVLSKEDCKVMVGVVSQTHVASLSQLLKAQASGLPSLGSIGHATGDCRACRYVGKECYKGKLCGHCHEQHPKKPRMPGNVRRALKRERREMEAQSSEVIQL